MSSKRWARRALHLCVLAALLPLALLAGQPASGRAVVPHPFHRMPAGSGGLAVPPTTLLCRALLGRSCYQARQVSHAYGMDGLHAAGLDGRGRTIVIVDPLGSPTIEHDLRQFDAAFGLPDPPSFRVIMPIGPSPRLDPGDADAVGWAEETTLDVEAAHLMAPGAGVVLVTTPVSETEGLQGFPEIMRVEDYVLEHDLGDVISQSFGATEETFPGRDALRGLRGTYERARRNRVTVISASGDEGATDLRLDGSCCFEHQANSWPSSDPLVTSIGGTQLHLDDLGGRMAPDNVWNDSDARGLTLGAGGGGPSAFFPGRTTPDLSLSAAIDGALVVYWSFAGAGYHLIGGTSEAAPLFAGMVAVADQIRGGRLGWLDDRLARMGARGAAAGIVDVTAGDNHATFPDRTGRPITVPGFSAGPGYDMASGWGTPDGERFCRELAAL